MWRSAPHVLHLPSVPHLPVCCRQVSWQQSSAAAHLNTTSRTPQEGSQGMAHQGTCQPDGRYSSGQQSWKEAVSSAHASKMESTGAWWCRSRELRSQAGNAAAAWARAQSSIVVVGGSVGGAGWLVVSL